MPIPSSVLNSLFPFGTLGMGALYPSRATLRPVTVTVATTGQRTHTFADSIDPTQVNLYCRLSPLIQVRPQLQEKVTGNGVQVSDRLQLNFTVCLVSVPKTTLLTWQVKVDGTVYQIVAIDHDGSLLTSRMEVILAAPYNP